MAATDFFPIPGRDNPAVSCLAITPADANLSFATRALYVGAAGNVVLIAVTDSNPVTFANVPAGTILPVSAIRVTTATTASQIVALF